MTNDDIFNRASYNQNSEEDKINFSKYPAYEIFKKNEYSMQQVERAYPREYEILINMHMEAALKSNFLEELLHEYKDCLIGLLKDIEIQIIIAQDDAKFKAYDNFRKKIHEIIEKHLKLGDEFEASLNNP